MINNNTLRINKGTISFLLLICFQILISTKPIFAQKVDTGIDVLQKTNYSILKGKKDWNHHQSYESQSKYRINYLSSS